MGNGSGRRNNRLIVGGIFEIWEVPHSRDKTIVIGALPAAHDIITLSYSAEIAKYPFPPCNTPFHKKSPRS